MQLADWNENRFAHKHLFTFSVSWTQERIEMNRRKFLGVGLAAFAIVIMPTTDLKAMDFRATKPMVWEAEKTAEGIISLYAKKGT